MFLLCLLLVAFTLGCVYLLEKKIRLSSMTRNIPEYPDGLPIIGHMHKYKTLYKIMLDKENTEIGVKKFWFGPHLSIAVTDPVVAHTILNTCLKKSYVYKWSSSWMGEGLVTADVPTWKRHRKLLNPAFSQHVLERFLEVFNNQGVKFVKILKDKVGSGEFEPSPYFFRNSLETICLTALGLDDREVGLSKEYEDAVHNILEVFRKRFHNILNHIDATYAWTKLKKYEDKLVAILKDLPDQVLRKNVLAMQSPGYVKNVSVNRFKSFMEILLEMADTGSLSDQEIKDEVDTMIMAGFDTTSRALMFILANVSRYPEVQEKLYKEINRVCGNSDTDVLKEDLPSLVYTEAVIKETLRLYPTAPVVGREVERDVKFENFTIPAGSTVYVNVYSMHQNRFWGADPKLFKPERWLDPAHPIDEQAYMPFGYGRRTCIGKNYAMWFMKTTLVHILRAYKVIGSNKELRFQIDAMLKPVSGHHFSLELR